MRKTLLVAVLVLTLILCGACTSEQLGYRKYPYIIVNPSVFGNTMKLRIPLDDNKYVYYSHNFENTENGIDMIIHFTKKGET